MRTLTLSSLLSSILALLSSCGGGYPPHTTATAPAAGPPVPVSLLKVERHPFAAAEDVVGTVRSRQMAMVEAKISGRIEQFVAEPGQSVKAGDLLVQLDVREVQARVDQAKASLELAERELQRYTNLLQQNAATRQEFDAAEARQRVGKAALAEAQTMLDYARVAAPFDGVVTRKLAEVGDLAAPGRPLVQIENPTALRFETDIPEALIDRIKIGQKLPVKIPTLDQTLEATVGEIAPAAEAVSRTFLVKLDLPVSKGLRTGQFGRVAVPLGEQSVVSVPKKAVIKRGQMEMVFIIDGGTARLRLVKTGRTLDGDVEIVSGLEAGEQIVADIPGTLHDGQAIEITKP